MTATQPIASSCASTIEPSDWKGAMALRTVGFSKVSCKLDSEAWALTEAPSFLLNFSCVWATFRHTSDCDDSLRDFAARFRSEVPRLNEDELNLPWSSSPRLVHRPCSTQNE